MASGGGVYPQTLQASPFFESEAVGAVAVINGLPYSLKKYTVTTNCHGATDTASITLPISINQDFTVILSPANDSNATDLPIYVKIYAGYPDTSANSGSTPSLNGLVLRFYGVLDQYTAVFEQDEVTFACRSMAAPLTTERIQATFGGSTVTTVNFVGAMAAKYGLTTNIFPGIKPLTMQQVLANELQSGVHVYPVWDLILQCAVQDDVDVWVDSYGVLWYYPSAEIPRNQIYLKWGRDIATLSMTHAVQFAKNVEVRIHSYVPTTKISSSARTFSIDGVTYATQSTSKVVTSSPVFGTNEFISSTTSNGQTTTSVSSKSGGAALGQLSGPANYSGKQVYERWLKNKTQAECQAYAAKYYRQIILHEYQIAMRLPVTKALLTKKSASSSSASPTYVSNFGITAQINLSGAPYAKINTGLWPREITEVFDPGSGYFFEVSANVNPPAQGGV